MKAKLSLMLPGGKGRIRKEHWEKMVSRSFFSKNPTDLFKQDLSLKLLTDHWRLPQEYLK